MGADQAQGERRHEAEQDDANERGEPQAVHRIHYVFAEQYPIAGKDLKQWITAPLTVLPIGSSHHHVLTILLIPIVVKRVVERLQVLAQMCLQS